MNYNYSYFKQLNPGVQSLVKWQFNEHGGFFSSLWKCISTADMGNLEKLEKAYPEEVRAYRRYSTEGGYWEHILENLRKPEVR